jgi:hypothetical protein
MLFKITVLGDGGVGKTALTVQVGSVLHFGTHLGKGEELGEGLGLNLSAISVLL